MKRQETIDHFCSSVCKKPAIGACGGDSTKCNIARAVGFGYSKGYDQGLYNGKKQVLEKQREQANKSAKKSSSTKSK